MNLRAITAAGGLGVAALLQQAGGCASEVETHQCQPIEVQDNYSRGLCWNLQGHNARIVAKCEGPSNPTPSFWYSPWNTINGLGMYAWEGGSDPARCNWPNYVSDRFYDFSH